MDDLDRRVKLLALDQTEVLELFRRRAPQIVNLPDGVRVLAVEKDFAHRTFDFLIQHPSFPVHKAGTIVERIWPQFSTSPSSPS